MNPDFLKCSNFLVPGSILLRLQIRAFQLRHYFTFDFYLNILSLKEKVCRVLYLFSELSIKNWKGSRINRWSLFRSAIEGSGTVVLPRHVKHIGNEQYRTRQTLLMRFASTVSSILEKDHLLNFRLRAVPVMKSKAMKWHIYDEDLWLCWCFECLWYNELYSESDLYVGC